jgi:hypothetical protein
MTPLLPTAMATLTLNRFRLAYTTTHWKVMVVPAAPRFRLRAILRRAASRR